MLSAAAKEQNPETAPLQKYAQPVSSLDVDGTKNLAAADAAEEKLPENTT